MADGRAPMDREAALRAAVLDALESDTDRLTRRERAALARLRGAGDQMEALLSGSGKKHKEVRLEWRTASGVLDVRDFGRRGL